MVFPKARPVESLVRVLGSKVLGKFWVKDKMNYIACPSRLGVGPWVNVKIITAPQSAKRQDEMRRVVVRSKKRWLTLRNVLIYVNKVDP